MMGSPIDVVQGGKQAEQIVLSAAEPPIEIQEIVQVLQLFVLFIYFLPESCRRFLHQMEGEDGLRRNFCVLRTNFPTNSR